MNKGHFSRVEQRIEQLVEGSFARLFAGRLHPREVAIHLAHALEDNAHPAAQGGIMAPNVFSVHLNPEDHAALVASQPDLINALIETVIDLAHRAGMRLKDRPTLELVADPELALRMIAVQAYYEDRSLRSTQMLKPVVETKPLQEHPRNPHLILGGSTYIPLDRPVVNIGRRNDNHIVINDPRISRQDAQLPLRPWRYVLFDLGSRGGTLVNEHAIQECILKPGDVISLAGIPLIYIE